MSEISGYTFAHRLASGGMGDVSLVVRQNDDFRRIYAMKRLKGASASDPVLRELFKDEARLCGLLQHPNVVSVLDVQEDEQGPFMVMDYIHGMTAAQILSGCRNAEVLPPLQVVVRIMLDVAKGLRAAHELRGDNGELLGVVHRDLSPPNVLVGFDGVARVSDFGVARSDLRSSQTETGVLKGKLAYMAPEQLRFESASVQTDLFAFGVVFFEVLTCTRLYQGASAAETARMIFDEAMPDVADVRTDVHPSIVALLFRLLAKKAGDRPESAEEVASLLENVLAELVSMEGALTVREFLGARFADRQAALDEMVQSALKRVADEKMPPLSKLRPLEMESEPTETDPAGARATPWIRWAGLGLAAAVALGVGLALTTEAPDTGEAPATDTSRAEDNAPPVSPPLAEGESVAPVEDDGANERDDDAGEVDEESNVESIDDEVAAGAATKRPRRRGGMRRQSAEETPEAREPAETERRGRAVESLRQFGGTL